MADSVAHWALPPRSDNAAHSMLPASLDVVVDVLCVNLDVQGDWDLIYFPLFVGIDIRSSLQGDFSLIQEKFEEFSTNHPSSPGTYFDWRYAA